MIVRVSPERVEKFVESQGVNVSVEIETCQLILFSKESNVITLF